MSAFIVMIAFSLLMAFAFLGAFIWAVRSGQMDDPVTPAMRILTEETDETNNT